MASYLITGASRGIGLELTKQLLELPASAVSQVFALSRSTSTSLKEVIDNSAGRAAQITASVDDLESVQKAAQDVKVALKTSGLDVLVNNAGVSSYSPEGLKTVKPEDLQDYLNVNVTGAHRMIAEFLPLLEAGKAKKVINVTSTLGSITYAPYTKMVPTHAYKITKAALNMLNAQYAVDHKDAGFTFLAVSPGWLKTDLGGEMADLTVDVGVKELKRIILEADKSQNGKFVNIDIPGMDQYKGGEVPW